MLETENIQNKETKKEEVVNKRITFNKSTYKKINILRMLEDDMTQNMQESDVIGHIINKSVDYYYKSEEIQKKLQEL